MSWTSYPDDSRVARRLARQLGHRRGSDANPF
jgi:hypothetical protein